MAALLTTISVRNLAGLPDVEVALEPMTALIGPRGTGKSRLLRTIHWLLSGEPDLAARNADLRATAELSEGSGRRSLLRTAADQPTPPLPAVRFLPAKDRSPGDAEAAEAMITGIAELRLSGTSGEVLLIEEPELMLTPQQQRHLYGVLRRYAEQNQVVYSTRSPALLDASHYHEIVRLDRTASGTQFRHATKQVLDDEERLRLKAEFDHERTEMFFATCVLLVEGQTERQSLPLMFNGLGYDPDALGISIVELGGKSNFALVARVLAELRIPHVLVFDSDRGRPAAGESRELRRLAGKAPVFELDPDFEGAAGIHSHDDKVLDAWRHFSELPPERIPAVFRDIVQATVELADQARV